MSFLMLGVVVASLVVVPEVASATSISAHRRAHLARVQARAQHRALDCPWTSPAEATDTPDQLAAQVIARMDTAEKLSIVGLEFSNGYENETKAIPSLCLPALRLQDGPDGIAYKAKKVTQLPSSLGIAASFNPDLAYAYGQVEGTEARMKGIGVVQGPNLNVARVPNAGRNFEGYGEDPYLVSQFGMKDIEGIQSEDVMASAKHFTAYNQETDRKHLDEIIPTRALEELYLPAFKAAVEDANVASVMCAYGLVNGVNACQSPQLFGALASWGFQGFVRSDLRSVTDPVVAFRSGLDALKPQATKGLRVALDDHVLAMGRLNNAVDRILKEMFAYGLIAHPLHGNVHVDSATASHALFARTAAEDSMVLLKNRGHILPLNVKSHDSLAVIGTDAGRSAMTAGEGSSHVVAPFVVTPLAALRHAFSSSTISYAGGGETASRLSDIGAPENRGSRVSAGLDGNAAFAKVIPKGDRAGLETITETVVPETSGTYALSLFDASATWLFLDDHLLLQSPGRHGPMTWDTAANLTKGITYHFAIVFGARHAPVPRLGWKNETPAITAAAKLAAHATRAIVFVRDPSQEAADRPTLTLPGDENALISAVAAVNPRTIVIVNSGGAILMPWLSKVQAVLEAWFPGEEDGEATEAVLAGTVNPSGHLPVTFPASIRQTPAASDATFPGIGGVVHYSEGLDIGYRYLDAHAMKPLFPFGFGLSYTNFVLSNLKLTSSSAGVTANVMVTNSGRRAGSAVVQAYLAFPAAADEPPLQLKAFSSVRLSAGQSRSVALTMAPEAFEAYLGNAWSTVAGSYTIELGQSSADLPLRASIAAPPVPGPVSVSTQPGTPTALGVSAKGRTATPRRTPVQAKRSTT